MLNKKISAIIGSSVVITSLLVPQSTLAAESTETVPLEEGSLIPSNGVNSTTSAYEQIITPMYIPVTVNKPIKYKGVLTASQLKTVIDHYTLRSSQLDAINALTSLVNVSQGISDTFTAIKTIDTGISVASPVGIERMKKAYYTGENYYYVAVYASGVAPSLSIEVMGVYSKSRIDITYQK